MKTTGHLIKAQDDTTDGADSIADIAAEAAAEAVARSQFIQQETKKLAKKIESQPKEEDDRVSLVGRVLQDPVADVQDIRKRSIHQLDISNRLPWLKGLDQDKVEREDIQHHHELERQPRIVEEEPNDCDDVDIDDDDDGEQTQRDRDHLTSPDSGVIDHLSEATESLDGHSPISHSLSSLPHSSSTQRQQQHHQQQLAIEGKKDRHIQQQRNGTDRLLPLHLDDLQSAQPSPHRHYHHHHHHTLLQTNDSISSPLDLHVQDPDYPILPPPMEYPSLEHHISTAVSLDANSSSSTSRSKAMASREPDFSNYSSSLSLSNSAGDVYTMKEAKLNASTPKAMRFEQTGASVRVSASSNAKSTVPTGQLSSKSRSNLLVSDGGY